MIAYYGLVDGEKQQPNAGVRWTSPNGPIWARPVRNASFKRELPSWRISERQLPLFACFARLLSRRQTITDEAALP